MLPDLQAVSSWGCQLPLPVAKRLRLVRAFC